MAVAKFTAVFCGWEGYRLGAVGRPDNDPSLVWIELLPDPDRVLICSGCGAVADAVHDTVERWVRDLPMFDAQITVIVRCAQSVLPTHVALLGRLAVPLRRFHFVFGKAAAQGDDLYCCG